MENFKYNDGGMCEDLKNKPVAEKILEMVDRQLGHSIVRAVAIAAKMEYKQVYDAIAEGHQSQKDSGKKPRNPIDGIDTKSKWFKKLMFDWGFVWRCCEDKSQVVEVSFDMLPSGRLVVALSGHYTCVIDGKVNDFFNPFRFSQNVIKGYWLRDQNKPQKHTEIINVTIPFKREKTVMPDGSERVNLTLRFSDTSAEVKDHKGDKIGYIGGGLGGHYEVSIEGKSYYADPKDIWNAFCKAAKKDELILDNED